MKFNKIFSTTLITLTAFTPTFFITSCNRAAKDPITDDGVEQFIHDRSFSLLGKCKAGATTYFGWGTGWIISDATKNVTNDYQYYIATNWHVVSMHEDMKTKYPTTFKMYYGDSTSSSGLDVDRDYTQFASYTHEDASNFYYSKTSQQTLGIDFYVAKADFAGAPSTIKTKLDRLNQTQAEKGYITQFADPITESKQYITDTMYIAGFPVKTDYHATWETHQFNSSDVEMIYLSKNDKKHTIDSDKKLYDIAPQYVITKNTGTKWMVGGASGSMLLGKFEDGYKVCGIYWGGWSTGSKFYPSFSIFRSEEKDFIAKYL